MAYFRECPHCGACLDPGEECECIQRRKQVAKRQADAIRLSEQEGMWEQMELEV